MQVKHVDSYPVFTRHKSVQRHGLSEQFVTKTAPVLPPDNATAMPALEVDSTSASILTSGKMHICEWRKYILQ
jgi:hypothetical protein